MKFWSGRRESNPRLLLGRQGHYHYATPASWWAGLDSNQRSALARRIYSPVPLTTRPPTQDRSLLGPPPSSSCLSERGFRPGDSGADGRIRTGGRQFTKLLLWPTKLRRRMSSSRTPSDCARGRPRAPAAVVAIETTAPRDICETLGRLRHAPPNANARKARAFSRIRRVRRPLPHGPAGAGSRYED